MASLGGIDAYMEQWLKTATKGNVRFTMAFLTNRMHLHCDVCNVGLTCEKPIDANTIDYAVQEYVKLHAHTGDKWKCELCGEWTHEPLTGPSGHGTTCTAVVKNGVYQFAKKIAELQLGDKKKAQEMVGVMQAKVDELQEEAKFEDAAALNAELQKKKQRLQLLELQEVQTKILWVKSKLKQVPTVVEHTPPPPKSAPVSDVFEDKGRKFR